MRCKQVCSSPRWVFCCSAWVGKRPAAVCFSCRGNPTSDTSASAYVCPVQNNELMEMLQERVRELEAEAEANRQQLEDTEQQLKDTQDANQ